MGFIIQHILDDKDNKRVTFFAQGPIDLSSPQYLVGWAMCSKEDSFSKRNGVGIALARAQKYAERAPKKDFPFFVQDALPEFLERCDQYFRGLRRPSWSHFMGHGGMVAPKKKG